MNIVGSERGFVLTTPASTQPTPPRSWQTELRLAVRDSRQLLERLGLAGQERLCSAAAAAAFPVFVPEPFLARMQPGDPSDPLLRQVLPLGEEMLPQPGFTPDPVGDLPAQRSAGLLQKYQGRALLVTQGACAIHCRYCFRRHFPYAEVPRGLSAWADAIQQIADDPTIEEVLLSGGDPLMLVDETLSALAQRLAEIPHLRRLRVHTRLPIVIPQRVTDELLGWLRGTRLTPLVVVHANHPAELDAATTAALGRLVDAGIPTLNQAVLLRGVNDHVDALAELCRRLVDARVLPYYLHQLDRVAGAAHFEVPVAQGLALMAALAARLPGYAVPRYVQEVAGAAHKVPLYG